MALLDFFKKAQNDKDLIAAAEGYLEETKVDFTKVDAVKVPLDQLATLGGGIASVLPSLRKVTSTMTLQNNGLYHCVFPKGVKGYLATAHNDGLNIGAIMNKNGIVGQARWVKAGPQTVNMTSVAMLNPATMMMAAALMAIEKKIDDVIEMQKKIFSFLEEDKQAKIEGDLKTLTDIIKEYKHCWDDEKYTTTHHKLVLDIKRSAEQNLKFHQKQVADILKSNQFLVSQQNVISKENELKKRFVYYRMSLYTYSFASFLEVMLQGNFSEGYVGQIRENILERMKEYREAYDECYKRLIKMSASSVENKVLKGLGIASKSVGNFIGSIPVLKDGHADEWLIESGTSVEKTGESVGQRTLEAFAANADSGCEVFADNLQNVDRLFNRTKEIYLDQGAIYLVS